MDKGIMGLVLGGWIAASAQAAPPPRDAADVTLVWKLDLAEDGAIRELEAVDRLEPGLLARLETDIRSWHFKPGKLGGTTAPTQTSLVLRVRVEPAAGGAWAVRLIDAQTGARVRKEVAPQYPDAAVASNRRGLVLLRVEYDANGKVTSSTVVDESPVKTGSLVGAARGAANRFEIEPERVGGRAVAGAALLPVCFSLVRTPSEAGTSCRWTRRGDEVPRDGAGGTAVALESMVSIEGDVAGRVL